MRRRDCPDALAEQLLLLTLATEQALAREDFGEATALFDRRDQILTRLEALALTPGAERRLGEVQVIEAGLAARLREWRTSLVEQIVAGRREGRAASAYRSPDPMITYDTLG